MILGMDRPIQINQNLEFLNFKILVLYSDFAIDVLDNEFLSFSE